MQCVLQTWERNIGSDRCKEWEGNGNQTYRGGRSTSSFFFSVLANIAESYPLKGRKCASRWEEAWKKKNDNKKTWIARIATIFRVTISKLGEISLFSCKNKRALLIAYIIEIFGYNVWKQRKKIFAKLICHVISLNYLCIGLCNFVITACIFHVETIALLLIIKYYNSEILSILKRKKYFAPKQICT